MENTSECKGSLFGLLIAVSLITLASCSTQPAVTQSAQDKVAAANLLTQAEALYGQRSDLQRAREGILVLRRAMAADSASYEAAWKFSRLAYYLAGHTENNIERDTVYVQGIDAGRRAVKLEDGKPEGHFWLGANLGGKAQTSMLSGLSAVTEIRAEMERVLRLDEGFQNGSAYMALGQIDLETPRMLGGDAKRAVEILEKGLRFGENNALYRLRLAQGYIAVNRKADARKQLDMIISSDPNPEFLPEHQDAVREAKALLDKGL